MSVTITSSPTLDVTKLLNSFLTAPKGNSPAEIVVGMLHWADVCNHPELYANDDPHPLAISAKKRSARQNLKRLVDKYPHLVAQAQAQRVNTTATSAATQSEVA
ncbi:MAG TPA: hypothetical protein VNW54_10475 [Granulicella sp.]|jgi:hypothetical protein|nr:hypothetical protein [Granulicella sp.]